MPVLSVRAFTVRETWQGVGSSLGGELRVWPLFRPEALDSVPPDGFAPTTLCLHRMCSVTATHPAISKWLGSSHF